MPREISRRALVHPLYRLSPVDHLPITRNEGRKRAPPRLLQRAFTKIDVQEDEIFYDPQHGVYHID